MFWVVSLSRGDLRNIILHLKFCGFVCKQWFKVRWYFSWFLITFRGCCTQSSGNFNLPMLFLTCHFKCKGNHVTSTFRLIFQTSMHVTMLCGRVTSSPWCCLPSVSLLTSLLNTFPSSENYYPTPSSCILRWWALSGMLSAWLKWQSFILLTVQFQTDRILACCMTADFRTSLYLCSLHTMI